MIRHVAGIAEIVEDMDQAVAYYRDVLGLPVEYDGGGDYATVQIAGILHFGLWSRRAAAQSIYGDADAVDRVAPGFTVGFEVDDTAEEETAMRERGATFVQATHEEPWGQTTARFITSSGGLAELSVTPWARTTDQPPAAR